MDGSNRTERQPGRRTRQWWLRVCPVLCFAGMTWLRCYMETARLAARPFFGYYVGLHHTLWFASMALVILLLARWILRRPVSGLLWWLYGSVLLLIPVAVWSWAGTSPTIDYLRGTPRQVLLQMLTFFVTSPENMTLTAELLVLFAGLTGLGFLHTRRAWRGLALAGAVHVAGTLMAVDWLGPAPHSRAILVVDTRLSNHALWSVAMLHLFSALVLLLLRVEGILPLRGKRLGSAVLCAAMGWIASAAAMGFMRWFAHGFECLLAALPFATAVFLAAFAGTPADRKTRAGRRVLLGLLLLQLAVFVPIYARWDDNLSPFGPLSPGEVPR